MRVLTLNCWGLKYLSRLRVARLRAIGDYLADTDYDVIALQEIWVESEDWRYVKSVCSKKYPHATFFFAAAFGAGLAVLSRHPIVSVDTHMYSLTGVPVFVHQGDWIAGKACGCATIQHPTLGLVDVWNTHQRAFRASEAFELAELCRASFEKGRHVLCMGDLNSLPDSLCISLLRDYAQLEDAYDGALKSGSEPDEITCDSPRNTWTKGKPLDALAQRHGGKRLDYVLSRSPGEKAVRCTSLKVTLDQLVPALGVSFSDHFGVEAEFELVQQPESDIKPAASEPLIRTAELLRGALVEASQQQAVQVGIFVGGLVGALASIVGAACAASQLAAGASAGVVVALGLATIAFSWVGTTALYSGVVWGEWHKRAIRGLLVRIETRVKSDD
ncbi:sphingomyelin phosphodiesterase [Malassezia cuniculi]|uniref:Sphingomyelin phosphodiesterase n=1 Tax=Malassezia cuniculi TaxID=948313 RepID=A0AAF0J721_9BASI|nr:sphingomyelin phosphodiesterase [Malassezia cuniculi]